MQRKISTQAQEYRPSVIAAMILLNCSGVMTL